MFGRLVNKLAKKPAPRVCRCREPKRHSSCVYCGYFAGNAVCGVCKENGVDGPVIRGTNRVVCASHKEKP